jgi:hypothetical protein
MPLVAWKGGGAGRSRTDLHGFAIRCITALLPRQRIHQINLSASGGADKNGKPGLPIYVPGAGNEARTRDLDLGKVALYQLSYTRMFSGGAGRSRTDLHGFAIRCITALLPRPTEPLAKRGSESLPFFKLEREKSLELSTSTLARLRSTN